MQKFLWLWVSALVVLLSACVDRPAQQVQEKPQVKKEQEPTLSEPSVVVKPNGKAKPKMAYADVMVERHGMTMPRHMPHPVAVDRERYQHFENHAVQRVVEQPVSTFSIDVDTGSYANVRRMLMAGDLPPKDAVRAEELINYFNYIDPAPTASDAPFHVATEIGPNPWNKDTHLLRIALKSQALAKEELLPANLVFLVDVSGSMQHSTKLPLLKRALKMLVRELDQDDRVSMVVYAGASGVVLEPTAGDQKATIEQALEKLRAGGSTNGASGIRLAYAKAREAFIKNGVNRVILATDGDFNVGTVNHQALIDLIERERKAGIALTTLGFGQGNYNEKLMEQIADHGDGNYGYIDSLLEARKVLVEEMGGTLQTVAKDVKIQVEFNPAQVSEYRLIGYENRVLKREDFNNDKVDAGEIGAGHSVVALYEVALQNSTGKRIEPLRYQQAQNHQQHKSDELAYIKLRYKQPDQSTSQLLSYPLVRKDIKPSLAKTSDDYRFAASVAAFAQQLRGAKYLNNFSYQDMLELARDSRGKDEQGYRSDFLRLVGLAQSLSKG